MAKHIPAIRVRGRWRSVEAICQTPLEGRETATVPSPVELELFNSTTPRRLPGYCRECVNGLRLMYEGVDVPLSCPTGGGYHSGTSARADYDAREKAVRAALLRIGLALGEHRAKFEAEGGTNWARVGHLGSALDLLGGIRFDK